MKKNAAPRIIPKADPILRKSNPRTSEILSPTNAPAIPSRVD
jgi:hypothetical protein